MALFDTLRSRQVNARGRDGTPLGRGIRRFKGSTEPVTRITGLLRNLGKIPEPAVQVLKAEYDSGPGRSSGFSVHPLLVPLVNELGDEDES